MITLRVFLLCLTLTACTEARTDTSRAAKATTVPLKSGAAAADDDCGADTSHIHPSARDLLNEYLDRDGRGEFMQADNWSGSAVECPIHTPGWDEAVLVTDWQIELMREQPDTAIYRVVFRRFGRVAQDSLGPVVVAEPGSETDTVTVVRKPYGWRIGGFLYMPHPLPSALANRGRWRDRDKQLLDSLIAATAGHRGRAPNDR